MRYGVGLGVVRVGVGVMGVAAAAAAVLPCRRRQGEGLWAVGGVGPCVAPRALGLVAAEHRGQVLLLLGQQLHLLPERRVDLLKVLALLGIRDTTQRPAVRV